ncbi:hypothetical protein AKJ53_01615 [candidate division MSBL1 archaeon SCGC-AAA382F02]|uniref:Tryptophan synthase alpha chain n=1 Tax=candidate division MSBL1 archaeon SCGC-AAA382F02 TaxID=1698282 RepID=A0A133VHS0_9EURY|nr:hypothetical protein AKJ53_01615 [candidate division MSBL1 archaeon SCGC-AAA382F02]
MKIEEKFRKLEDRNEGAYMPHIYYGDPTEEFSQKEVKILAENGADFLEFGIPFSDPTADGPVFQDACERALNNGITPEKCIRGIEKLREEGLEIPIIVTTYYNIPYKFGIESFLNKLNETGAQGLIVPNLPIEEANELLKASKKADIDIIFQVTPNTSEERLKKIVKASSGFLYVVNFEGVTGVRNAIANSTKELISTIKKHTNTPLMAGFGVSKPSHAKSLVSAGADGAITGSALGEIYGENLEAPEKTLSKIGDFAKKIKNGCNEGYENRT